MRLNFFLGLRNDAPSMQPLRSLSSHRAPAWSIGFSGAGSSIRSAGLSTTIFLKPYYTATGGRFYRSNSQSQSQCSMVPSSLLLSSFIEATSWSSKKDFNICRQEQSLLFGLRVFLFALSLTIQKELI